MKLRAIHPIKNGRKWTQPGKGFDCNKEDAEGLILEGYAEPFNKEESNETGATNSAAASAGGGVDAAPAPLSEGQGIG